MKKKVLIGVICALCVLVITVGIYWYYHPTHYKFNDRFIIGNTEENIVEKYGEFAYREHGENGVTLYGEYVASHYEHPTYVHGFSRKWYVIEFENGIATKIEIREGTYKG